MKVFAIVLVVSLAAAVASAAPANDPDVAATLGAKWGHWTLERLSWKRAEILSDLAQTRLEKNRVGAAGKKTCALIKSIGQQRVAVAKEAVSEWTDILAIRRGRRGYHAKRQAGYDSRHVYITQGPLSRRKATDKTAWCQANQEACDRWHHERRLYHANKFGQLKDRHGQVTAESRARVKSAKDRLKTAVDRLITARKGRADHNAACTKTFAAAHAHWKKRVDALKVRRTAVNTAITNVKDARTKRLATYKPFYMTKCRYIGGKHHMYYCFLDTHNADKAQHQFRVCKHRGPQQPNVNKLHFRCYK